MNIVQLIGTLFYFFEGLIGTLWYSRVEIQNQILHLFPLIFVWIIMILVQSFHWLISPKEPMKHTCGFSSPNQFFSIRMNQQSNPNHILKDLITYHLDQNCWYLITLITWKKKQQSANIIIYLYLFILHI